MKKQTKSKRVKTSSSVQRSSLCSDDWSVGQSGAKRRQKPTGDDCKESVFHSARPVYVTMAPESKPVFSNEEDKLLSFSLSIEYTKKHSLSKAFIVKSFVHIRLQIVVFVTRHKRSITINTGPLWEVGWGLEIIRLDEEGRAAVES